MNARSFRLQLYKDGGAFKTGMTSGNQEDITDLIKLACFSRFTFNLIRLSCILK